MHYGRLGELSQHEFVMKEVSHSSSNEMIIKIVNGAGSDGAQTDGKRNFGIAATPVMQKSESSMEEREIEQTRTNSSP